MTTENETVPIREDFKMPLEKWFYFERRTEDLKKFKKMAEVSARYHLEDAFNGYISALEYRDDFSKEDEWSIILESKEIYDKLVEMTLDEFMEMEVECESFLEEILEDAEIKYEGGSI